MKHIKHAKHINKKNKGIFYVAAIFLFLLAVQVVMLTNFFDALNADTSIIYDLSRGRGSIQRYAKLELSGIKTEHEKMEAYIDELLSYHIRHSSNSDSSRGAYAKLVELQKNWNDLKVLVDQYHANPSEKNKEAIISKSEECWKAADAYVVQSQNLLTKTTTYYKYLTLTFAFNILAIVITLLLYKRLVYNSLAKSAVVDALTGISNKGYFDEYLNLEIARAIRKQTSFCLIMFDIDHFKVVNDTYGHRRGDYALKALADTVKQLIRNADVLARIGGEEFIILVPDAKLSEAALLAERIRMEVERFPFEQIGKMTISLGITEFNYTDNTETILKRVDSALYKAKENGRNRCEVIGGLE